MERKYRIRSSGQNNAHSRPPSVIVSSCASRVTHLSDARSSHGAELRRATKTPAATRQTLRRGNPVVYWLFLRLLGFSRIRFKTPTLSANMTMGCSDGESAARFLSALSTSRRQNFARRNLASRLLRSRFRETGNPILHPRLPNRSHLSRC